MSHGDLDGASSTLDRALRIEPNNPLLWIERGRLRLAEGDAHQAEGCGRKALALADRGRLRRGAFADIVIFDPQSFQDHSTYEKPLQYATGVSDVLINGRLALKNGEPTGTPTGRVIHGRAWLGAPGGGCRASSRDWHWIDQPPAAHGAGPSG